jgi:hypothetical protein
VFFFLSDINLVALDFGMMLGVIGDFQLEVVVLCDSEWTTTSKIEEKKQRCRRNQCCSSFSDSRRCAHLGEQTLEEALKLRLLLRCSLFRSFLLFR